MALLGTAGANAALNGLAGVGSTNTMGFGALNTASPSTTGANENANTGSYARQASAWNAASGGSMTNSSSETYSTAGSTAVSHFSQWSSGTYAGGNYSIGGALAANVTAGTITVAAGAKTISAT